MGFTFRMDGQYAWPSSGEVLHVKRREILTLLKDDRHNTVSSEKMVKVSLNRARSFKLETSLG